MKDITFTAEFTGPQTFTGTMMMGDKRLQFVPVDKSDDNDPTLFVIANKRLDWQLEQIEKLEKLIEAMNENHDALANAVFTLEEKLDSLEHAVWCVEQKQDNFETSGKDQFTKQVERVVELSTSVDTVITEAATKAIDDYDFGDVVDDAWKQERHAIQKRLDYLERNERLCGDYIVNLWSHFRQAEEHTSLLHREFGSMGDASYEFMDKSGHACGGDEE
jgi:hypothetical protein